jgi:hypothetical protein
MLIERMWRAAMLQSALYEEVERDEQATTQAAIVVLLVAIATALGAYLDAALNGAQPAGQGLLGGLVRGIVSAFVGWVVWAYVTYFVGTRLFDGKATPGELLRTLGFAESPAVLHVFQFIPVLGAVISFVVAIWLLVAGIVAVRQALDFSTGKAIATAFISWLALVIVALIALLIAGLIGVAVPRF